MSRAAAVKNAAYIMWEYINKEPFRRGRCASYVVKQMLLVHDKECNLVNNKQVFFKKRSLGCGIYEVWMEVAEYDKQKNPAGQKNPA